MLNFKFYNSHFNLGMAYKDCSMLAASWACTLPRCHKSFLLSWWKPIIKYFIWQHCKVLLY